MGGGNAIFQNVIIQKLQILKLNPEVISSFLEKSKLAIQKNTWYDRAQTMYKKFQEVCNEKYIN